MHTESKTVTPIKSPTFYRTAQILSLQITENVDTQIEVT